MKRRVFSQFIRLFQRALPLLDFLVVFVSAWLAKATVPAWVDFNLPQYQLILLLLPLLVPAWFSRFGVYKQWRGRSVSEEVSLVWVAWASFFAFLAVLALFTKTGGLFSRLWMMHSFLWALVLLGVCRIGLRLVLNRLRLKGHNSRNIVLIGWPDRMQVVADRIAKNASSGLRVAAQLKTETDSSRARTLVVLEDILKIGQVDQLWIVVGTQDASVVSEVQKISAPYPVRIAWVPDVLGLNLVNLSVSEIAGLPVVNLQDSPMSGWQVLQKWLEDRVLATLILLVLSPLMLIIFLAVKVDSRGPGIFKQKRHGWGGTEIVVYKFRTMGVHQGKGVIQSATLGDPRITRIGKFLRRTSLDELPQFFNVLQGRMSIVGPRPHSVTQHELFTSFAARYPMRYKIKPGITGWAQINGYRGEIENSAELRKRLEYDLHYMSRWSLWLDLRIIVISAIRGWTGKKAY